MEARRKVGGWVRKLLQESKWKVTQNYFKDHADTAGPWTGVNGDWQVSGLRHQVSGNAIF